jgi:hypothetical protein
MILVDQQMEDVAPILGSKASNGGSRDRLVREPARLEDAALALVQHG